LSRHKFLLARHRFAMSPPSLLVMICRRGRQPLAELLSIGALQARPRRIYCVSPDRESN
jgi:hypothetical protein